MLDGDDIAKGEGGNLGGEGSGHILMPDIIASGDGLLSALQVIKASIDSGQKMSQILNLYESVPQKLVNLPNVDKAIIDDDEIIALCQKLTTELSGEGRILLRPSGTEPLVRVMVEATDSAKLDDVMTQLVTTLKRVNKAYQAEAE